MKEIRRIELEEKLLLFLRNLNTQFTERNHIYNLCFNTGIRISEAIKTNLWSDNGDSTMTLQTLKWNKTRVIEKELIPEYLLHRYIENINDFTFTYPMLHYDMKKEFPPVIFNGNTHDSVTHSFRYNYIKKLFDNGMPSEELMLHIGHKKVETTEYYINAPIWIDTDETQ
ncbi:MAG: tyrosine-type recombinase/integrase [Vibrio anguillarum]